MILALNTLTRINEEHLWLEFSTELQDEVWKQAQKSNSPNYYNAYLNRLCLETILPCFKEIVEQSVSTQKTIEQLPSIWEFVNGTAIKIGDTQLILIPSEANDIEGLSVPQEWVDIPGWEGAYYLAIQAELEENWLRIWGYTNHQKLKNEGFYDPLDRTYTLERDDLTEDISLLWVALDLCLTEKAEIKSLPELLVSEAENLIKKLGQIKLYSSRLNIPFEKWAVLFSNDQYRQGLYQLCLAETSVVNPVDTLINSIVTPLGQWLKKKDEELQELIQTGWLSYEFARSRDVLYKRKQITLGENVLYLVIGIRELNLQTFEIEIVVRSHESQTYLPKGLKLILEDDQGNLIPNEQGQPMKDEVRDNKNYLQMKLEGETGESFRVKILFNGLTIIENVPI